MQHSGRYVVACALVILFARPGTASDWERYKSDCDQVFKSHRTVVVQRLKECTGLWTAYADPNTVRPADAQRLKIAFQGLYDRSMNSGDEEGEFLARGAAERLRTKLVLKLKRPGAKPGERAETRILHRSAKSLCHQRYRFQTSGVQKKR